MSKLELLTEEQKAQAFLKARAEIKLTEGKLMRITENNYEKALDFIRDYFFTDEPLQKAVGARWGKQVRELHLEELSQNLALMIVNEENGDIMATVTNQVVKKDASLGEYDLEDDGLKAAYTYVHICEERGHLFDHFNVDEAVCLMNLATNREYRNRGLASQVVMASLAMIRNFGVGMVCVKSEGSSIFSQKILEKEGMVCLYTGVNDEHERNGKKVFEETGIHKCVKIYGMMVQTGSRQLSKEQM